MERLGATPDELSQREIRDLLADALHIDICDYCAARPDVSLLIVVDGFERIQSLVPADDIQKSLAHLCRQLSSSNASCFGRIGMLLVGRERLLWSNLYGSEWTERIHSWRIIGFSENDARQFIHKASQYHEEAGDCGIVDVLQRNEDTLLEVTREHYSDDENGFYHPYFLDLAYDFVRRRGLDFRAEDLGGSATELQIRFLGHLQAQQPGILRAFQCLALAGLFNKDIYRRLVEASHIPAGLPFASLVGADYSFVEPIQHSQGNFRFHTLMELALLRSQASKSPDVSVATERIECILSHLLRKARFTQIGECSAEHMSAYDHAMRVAFERYYNGFLDIVRVFRVVQQLEESFGGDVSFASKRASNFEELLSIYLDRKGENVDVMFWLGTTIGRLRAASGDLERAEDIYRTLLALSEQTLGLNDSRTVELVANVAPILQMLGKLGEAEAFYRRALESFAHTKESGQARPHCITNLATLLTSKGDYDAAKQLGEHALAMAERTHGPNAHDTLLAANNLAIALQELDKLDECEALSKKTLSACENTLGPDHSFTLVSLDNLALLAQKRGDFGTAESLFRRALEGSERTFGAKRKETLIRLSNLASLLHTKGDAGRAEVLHRKALEGLEERFGPDHPDVLVAMTNLCVCLLKHRQNTSEVRRFCDRAIEISMRVLGGEHPISLRAVNNMGLLYEAEGDFHRAVINYRKAVSGLKKVFGAEHSTTSIVQGNLDRVLKRI